MPYKDPERQKAAQRAAYERDRQSYIDRGRISRLHRQEIVDKLKDGPCVDCGNRFPPCAMEWDHITDDKVADVSRMIRTASLTRLMAEIEKCELVCGNCHAIRTWKRSLEAPSYRQVDRSQGTLFE